MWIQDIETYPGNQSNCNNLVLLTTWELWIQFSISVPDALLANYADQMENVMMDCLGNWLAMTGRRSCRLAQRNRTLFAGDWLCALAKRMTSDCRMQYNKATSIQDL